MLVVKNQHAMKARRFQTGQIEKSQIQTGSQLLLQQAVAEPHPLTTAKASWRHTIPDILLLKGAINRRHLKPDQMGTLSLIANKGGFSPPLFQNPACIPQDFPNNRLIGGDKSRRQLGNHPDTRPLIHGQ